MKHHDFLSAVDLLLVQPDDGITPVLERLAKVKTTLDVKQFSLTEPRIIQAIIDAHQRGVAVRVLLNPVNTGGVRENDASFAAFEQAGVPVRWTNPSFAVSHEKSVVFDGGSVLISTFNLSIKYFTQTRDAGLVTSEPAVVQEVLKAYNADWDRAPFTPEQPALAWGNVNARNKMGFFIDSATTRLDICHPKYVDVGILDRIVSAQERGVHVRVLCGGKHGVKDYDLVDTLSSLRLLRSTKVKVHRMQNLKVHIKLVIVDEAKALLGSMNIHRNAFDVRRELGALIDDKKAVGRLLSTFESDWGKSHHWDVPDPLQPHTHPKDEPPDDPEFSH